MGITHSKTSGSVPPKITGSDWDAGHVVGDLDKGVFGITVDGGGSAITTGAKGSVRLPGAGTITSWTILADQAGSAVIDVWKDVIGSYPPTDADSITAAAPPTLNSAASATSSTLTGWTTSFAAGDVFRFNVDSAATVTRLTLELHYTKG